MNPIPFVLEGDLLTGINGIDDQHRQLFELASRAVNDNLEHFGNAWFNDALGAFVDYTHYHFAAEEHLMRRLKYPGFERHRALHDQFRLDLSEVVDASRKEPTANGLRARLAQTIESWLMEHIRVTDQQLAEYVRQHESSQDLRLADSSTLRRAGVLVAEIEAAERPASTASNAG